MPDMSITVGHIIDNPTFMFFGNFEITTSEDDGSVTVLYDSLRDIDSEPSVELLIEKVTYLAVNENANPVRLRIEVR